MKWIKPSAGLIAELQVVRAQLPQAEPRKMFGYDALFVNGNMAVGLWQNTCVVKLAQPDQDELLARGAAMPFCPMPGRAMNGWLELTEELAHDPEELLEWSRRAVEYTASLPPKRRKQDAAPRTGSRAAASQAPERAASKSRGRAQRAVSNLPPNKSSAERPRAEQAPETTTSAKRQPTQKALAADASRQATKSTTRAKRSGNALDKSRPSRQAAPKKR